MPNPIPISAQCPHPDSGLNILGKACGSCGVLLDKNHPQSDDAPVRRAFDAPPGVFPYSRVDTGPDDYDANVTSRDRRPVFATELSSIICKDLIINVCHKFHILFTIYRVDMNAIPNK